jgi:hypothetical protein
MHTFTNMFTLFTLPSQTVTATDTLSPSITGTAAVNVVLGALRFSVAIRSVALFPSAGVALNLTVTALDALGNTASGYRGTVHFTSSDPHPATLPADYTFTTADSGTHIFVDGVTLFTAGSPTVTATDTVTPAITGTAAWTVNPAPASRFGVVISAGLQTAGVAATLTVTALDAFGNTASPYRGTVHFTSSDPHPATLPADYTFTAADSGTHVFASGVTLFTTGFSFSQTVTATDTLSPSIIGTAAVTLNNAPASILRISAPSVLYAGVAGTVTVTVVDPFGNTAYGYAGTVHFTSSDPAATLPADYRFRAVFLIGTAYTCGDCAVHTFTNELTLRTSGNQTLIVTDTVTSTFGGGTAVVVP